MGQSMKCICGKRFVLKDSFQGSSVKCPACGERIAIDDDSSPAFSVPGIHSTGKKKRSRNKAPTWIVPVGCTLLGIVGTAVIVLLVSGRSNTDASAGKTDDANSPSVANAQPALARNAAPQAGAGNSGGADNNRPEVDRDDAPRRVARTADGDTGAVSSAPSQVKIVGSEKGDDADDTRAAAGVAQLADLIEDVEHCVVRLDFVSARGKGCGSGFVVDKDGTIVTNYHVVEEVQTMTATFNDNTKLAIEGFKHVVPSQDLAVLQTATPRRSLPFLRLAKKIPRKGESVVAFGSPLGLSFSASEGIVSGIRTAAELAELGADVAGTWIQMTTQISPGNSGGPLVNQRGEVVGVNTMTLTAGQNLNFAVSCDDVRLAVDKARGQKVTGLSPERLAPASGRRSAARPATEDEIAASEDVHLAKTDLSPAEKSKFESLSKSVWFGVKWVDVIDFDARATRGLPSRSGIVVTEVAYHSPAYRAGIKAGDVIRTIDGEQAAQTSVVEELVDDFVPGQSVSIQILRPESPGRYSKKDVTVRVEATLPRQVLDQVARSETPIEVRDFLKRHLMRYFATLAESISSAAKQASRNRIGNSPAQASALSVKELRQMSPFDPLFLPAFGSEVPVHVGNIGALKRMEVLAIVSRKMVVARINRGLIALLADTSNMVDHEYVNLGTAQIIGTVTIGETRTGRIVKIFVARPFVVDKFLPEWNASEGDDDDDDG
jgi:S1-C subfamily serine protease